MPKTLSRRLLFASLNAALLSCVAFNLKAQSVTETYASTLGQGNTAIVTANSQAIANQACAPTATANGLSYLYSIDPAAFNTSPNNYTAVNTLITDMGTTTTGTTGANAISGTQTYLSSVAPNVTATQNSDPVATDLYNALNAGEAVQIGVLWGQVLGSGPYTFSVISGGGGHFLSLTGINLTADTMTVLDPWGTVSGANASSAATSVTLSFASYNVTGIGTVLEVKYPGFTGPDDNGTGDGTASTSYGQLLQPQGYIAIDDIEAVPEPSTMALMGAGALALLAKWRRKA